MCPVFDFSRHVCGNHYVRAERESGPAAQPVHDGGGGGDVRLPAGVLMGRGELCVCDGPLPGALGNELRAGMLEAAMALLFCVIMLLALWGGMEEAPGIWKRIRRIFTISWRT